MNKKYKLTKEYIFLFGKKLYRIKALKDFANVRKGDKGGFVESEANLSQEGDCWVYGNSKIFDIAQVCDYARVYGNVLVYGNAIIANNAQIYNNARIHNNAKIYDHAIVYGNALVSGNAQVFGKAFVSGNAWSFDNAKIYDNAGITDNVEICGDAQIYGNVKSCGNAEIKSDAKVKNTSDYIVFKNWWSSGRYFTWTRSNNMWRVGCFYGTGKQLCVFRLRGNCASLRRGSRGAFALFGCRSVRYCAASKCKLASHTWAQGF